MKPKYEHKKDAKAGVHAPQLLASIDTVGGHYKVELVEC
jgi:hypothetical protein